MNIADEMISKTDPLALAEAITELNRAAFALPGPDAVFLIGWIDGDAIRFEIRSHGDGLDASEVLLLTASALTGDEHDGYADVDSYANSRDAEHSCTLVLRELREYAWALRRVIARDCADEWLAHVQDFSTELDGLRSLRLNGVPYPNSAAHVRAAFDPRELLSDKEADAVYEEVLTRVADRATVAST